MSLHHRATIRAVAAAGLTAGGADFFHFLLRHWFRLFLFLARFVTHLCCFVPLFGSSVPIHAGSGSQNRGSGSLTHFGSFGSLIPSTNSPRDAASNLSASGWLILAACIILFTSSAVTFIGSGCSESSAVSTFCGKPVYVPFFSGKIFFFCDFSGASSQCLIQTRKFVCATVFFSVLICEEEIERPLTLYRWFSFRRGFIFLGYQIPSVSTASVCVSDDWRTSTVPVSVSSFSNTPFVVRYSQIYLFSAMGSCECRSDAHGQGQKIVWRS